MSLVSNLYQFYQIRRNEKVVDLKKILTGAKITIPAKANKAELIQTILKSKDALAYYETMKGDGSGDASGVTTPVPVAATPSGNEPDAGGVTAPKDDLVSTHNIVESKENVLI